MKTVQQWFEDYGVSHQNKSNIIIHKVCVPLITWSLLGILWTIPVPRFFYAYHLNWTYVFCLLCLVFYISLRNLRLLAAIITLVFPVLYLLETYSHLLAHRILYLSIGVFIIAWIGQFIGHKIEGQKPSFLEDIQFLLIGPAWIFKDFLKINSK